MDRINDKIAEIEKYSGELETIMPETLDEYHSSLEKRAACERYFEKIVEAITDLAFLIIKTKKLKIPEDDADAFNILLENRLIDEALSKKLKDAKGMRNIIAHQYGRIDDELVYDAITEKIRNDALEFVKIAKRLK
jgi:uncharacterized protein YutE (UPF0331/DUF86 family)